MARRKKELGIFEMLMELPWWGGVTFAVVSYIFIGIILPNKWATDPNAKWLVGFCSPFAKMAAFAGLLAAGVSAIRSLKNRPPSVGRRTMAYSPARPVAVPVADIDVECPQCKAVLVAPDSMVGQPVSCEGCRHSFLIPKPVIKFPDMTDFYSPKRSGQFLPTPSP